VSVFTPEGVGGTHDLACLLPHVYVNTILLNQIHKRVTSTSTYTNSNTTTGKLPLPLPLHDCLLLGLSDVCYILLNTEIQALKSSTSNTNTNTTATGTGYEFPDSTGHNMDISNTPFNTKINMCVTRVTKS